MPIGLLTLHLQLPGCSSLKEKRSRLKPLLARLHREFNLSVAEMDQNDHWSAAIIACALVANQPAHIQRSLCDVTGWIEKNWLDVMVVEDQLEII
jgi:uncharacterized protein